MRCNAVSALVRSRSAIAWRMWGNRPVERPRVLVREQRPVDRSLQREIDLVVGLAIDQAGHHRAHAVAVQEVAIERMPRNGARTQLARIDVPAADRHPRRKGPSRVQRLEGLLVGLDQSLDRIGQLGHRHAVVALVEHDHAHLGAAARAAQVLQAALPRLRIHDALVESADGVVDVAVVHCRLRIDAMARQAAGGACNGWRRPWSAPWTSRWFIDYPWFRRQSNAPPGSCDGPVGSIFFFLLDWDATASRGQRPGGGCGGRKAMVRV
ncbi:hypothetical protein [Cupriavidus sp. H18C1]|uniref:hypothetical protein n=1 Tax=Cupriavidus sp. H18C1 TaxID=3241601 RepID=UPI003BB8A235